MKTAKNESRALLECAKMLLENDDLSDDKKLYSCLGFTDRAFRFFIDRSKMAEARSCHLAAEMVRKAINLKMSCRNQFVHEVRERISVIRDLIKLIATNY